MAINHSTDSVKLTFQDIQVPQKAQLHSLFFQD